MSPRNTHAPPSNEIAQSRAIVSTARSAAENPAARPIDVGKSGQQSQIETTNGGTDAA